MTKGLGADVAIGPQAGKAALQTVIIANRSLVCIGVSRPQLGHAILHMEEKSLSCMLPSPGAG